MSPYLLRSAVAVLRRPTPQGSAFLRRSVASGGALRVDTKGCCMVCVQALEESAANLKEANKHLEFLLEHERRFERSEQRQKKLACVLIPATIAFYRHEMKETQAESRQHPVSGTKPRKRTKLTHIFGPEKKGKPSSEGQSEI